MERINLQILKNLILIHKGKAIANSFDAKKKCKEISVGNVKISGTFKSNVLIPLTRYLKQLPLWRKD